MCYFYTAKNSLPILANILFVFANGPFGNPNPIKMHISCQLATTDLPINSIFQLIPKH